MIDEATLAHRATEALAAAYLLEDDPRWQSGFDGDAALWRQARELVVEAVDRDGTLLDVGCANGHSMECLVTWAAERSRRLVVSVLELNPDLASMARHRLPAWADRIVEGNVLHWEPPRAFTYIRTGLEYVPVDRRVALVARLLSAAVEPGGRLIVGPVSDGEVTETLAVLAAGGCSVPGVRTATDRTGKTRHVLWVEREFPA